MLKKHKQNDSFFNSLADRYGYEGKTPSNLKKPNIKPKGVSSWKDSYLK